MQKLNFTDEVNRVVHLGCSFYNPLEVSGIQNKRWGGVNKQRMHKYFGRLLLLFEKILCVLFVAESLSVLLSSVTWETRAEKSSMETRSLNKEMNCLCLTICKLHLKRVMLKLPQQGKKFLGSTKAALSRAEKSSTETRSLNKARNCLCPTICKLHLKRVMLKVFLPQQGKKFLGSTRGALSRAEKKFPETRSLNKPRNCLCPTICKLHLKRVMLRGLSLQEGKKFWKYQGSTVSFDWNLLK
ncbi:hypothetical protein CEXT_326891 [Caerostris extrusa]|uniref:Uncharacterized protein n=1 Tax=Caerostris extrusa TaxID=172846 RepID=A0AAV4T1Q9_CAEEX|nr:hypothetical protein CEXT_326891 [Caerostris extrusa]